MDLSLVILLTFLGVALGVTGAYSIYRDFVQSDEARARLRVGAEFRSATPEANRSTALFQDLDNFDVNALSKGAGAPMGPVAATTNPADETFRERLAAMLTQSGLNITQGRLLGAAVGAAVFIGMVGFCAIGPLTGLAGFAAGLIAPFAYVRMRQVARREKLLGQLPEAFELMARVLRAGQSVPQAFQTVADSCDQPIAGEFSLCQEQQNLGLLPEVAFHDLAQRTGVLEIKIFVMAMMIQRQTGGNLSEVLERLSGLIRDRVRLRGQIRTLTAEGRLQAGVLLVMPPIMFFVMRVLNQKYADVLLEHKGLLLATAASMLVGALWIRKTIQIDV